MLPNPIIGIIGVVVALSLVMLGLPLGIAFGAAGFIGIIVLRSLDTALPTLGSYLYLFTSNLTLCAIPLFILMGQFAYYSGISHDLFTAANKWIGRLPGGLASATALACTGFAACTGTSVAGAATMGVVAFPEMEKFNYSPRLSTGCIAAGGTLGILIPPSVVFIVYGVLTETSVVDLFIAGILPGLMLSALFIVAITIMCKLNPKLGPPGESFTWKEKFASLRGIWGMLMLLLLVVGGLYFGIFAPSEAGAIGAFGAFIIMLTKGQLTKSNLFSTLKETTKMTAFAMLAVSGILLFITFVALSNLASLLVSWTTALHLSPFGTLIVILAFYVPLGCIIESVGMILLTMPIVFPIIQSLGFDPVWFGVLICVLSELSLITPPIGVNMYIVQGVTNVPLREVALGILPFALVLVIGVVILLFFPEIALFLPGVMK